MPAHAEHPHPERPAPSSDRGADTADADHQQRLSADRCRVQRLPVRPPLVADDGGEAVVQHQHRHEPVLSSLVRVCAAVVDHGDPGRHPVHGAQVLHPGPDDVDQAQVRRDLGQVRGGEIPGHQHLGGAHRALEVVEIPVDEHVEMPRHVRIPGRGVLEAFAGDGEHRLAFRCRWKRLRGGVVVLDVDPQGSACCHDRRGMRAGGLIARSAHGSSSRAGGSVSAEAWPFPVWTREVRLAAMAGKEREPAVRSPGERMTPGALTTRPHPLPPAPAAARSRTPPARARAGRRPRTVSA